MPVTIKPVLVGVSSTNLKLDVANTEFIREKKEELLAVLPVIVDLATGALGDLPSITVPAFAGFSLENLTVSKIVAGQDAFLSVTGNLGAQTNPTLAARAGGARPLAAAVSLRQANGSARLAGVSVPPLDEVRAAVEGVAGNAMPSVTFEVDGTDDLGRELEWSWRLDHGLWRPYSSASPLVIRDRAFAFQGDYTVSLMSRVKGDFRTVSSEQEHQVRIDSVAPHLVKDATQWRAGPRSRSRSAGRARTSRRRRGRRAMRPRSTRRRCARWAWMARWWCSSRTRRATCSRSWSRLRRASTARRARAAAAIAAARRAAARWRCWGRPGYCC
jgi:hypothetical protein